MLPEQLTIVNRKAAQIANEIYKAAIENNSFADTISMSMLLISLRNNYLIKNGELLTEVHRFCLRWIVWGKGYFCGVWG